MTVAEDQLDRAFIALADPTRRAIVARLAHGDATVNELAAPFQMSLPGISKHLKVLERSGLISRSRQAQFRPCHLEREALDAAAGWIEENRRIWAERFDKLDAHLRTVLAQGGDPLEPPGSQKCSAGPGGRPPGTPRESPAGGNTPPARPASPPRLAQGGDSLEPADHADPDGAAHE